MAKNLIDDNSFEFVEGTEKDDYTALESRVATAEGDIDAAEGDIDSLEGRMTTAEGDIDSLESRMGTAEGDIDSVESDIQAHANNNNVHLTAAEKAYLDEPYVLGTYTGLGGTADRDVNIGFTPRLVLVYAGALVPVEITDPGSSGAQSLTTRFGFAADTYGTKNIEIINNGFRVSNHIDSGGTRNVVFLNETGTTYTYLAFRQL